MGVGGGEGPDSKNGWRVLGRQNNRYPLLEMAGYACNPLRKLAQCRELRGT